MIDFRDTDINHAVILPRELYAERLIWNFALGFVVGVIVTVILFV